MRSVGGVVVPALALAGLCACGEPLVDGSYRGEPLLSLTGDIRLESTGYGDSVPLATLSWHMAGEPVEQDAAVVTDFPTTYTLDVYVPPSEDALQETLAGDGEIAMGLPILYTDVDGDGVWLPGPEPIVGVARNAYVVWTADTVQLPATTGELGPGYHVLVNDGCEDPGPPEQSDGTGVDLVVGEICKNLMDPNCDGQLDEWGGLCKYGDPPPPQ